jgi:hypothetical protein
LRYVGFYTTQSRKYIQSSIAKNSREGFIKGLEDYLQDRIDKGKKDPKTALCEGHIRRIKNLIKFVKNGELPPSH